MFKSSAGELKSIRCLTVTGVLIALFVVLDAYAIIRINQSLKITFSFIPLAVTGMLYGPVVCMLAAIPCDILGVVLGGGGFLPLFTLVCVIQGFVYGVLLYKFEVKKSFWENTRLLIAQTVVIFGVNLVLNTSVLYYYGIIGGGDETLYSLIALRVVKNLTLYPIEAALLYLTLVPVRVAYTKVFGRVGT
jgi:ECF transporter S component (folate family)